jgi:hypothetical protein
VGALGGRCLEEQAEDFRRVGRSGAALDQAGARLAGI